jgi:flagellar motor switch protein FliN/FliY
MKSFLEIWAESFPEAVKQKLGEEVSWEPSDELPAREGALAVELRWEGAWNGRCVLVGSWAEVAQLLGQAPAGKQKAARKAPDEAAVEAWTKWLQETVHGMALPEQPAAIVRAEMPRGVPMAAWRLLAGERAVQLALAPEVRTESEPAKAESQGAALLEGAAAASPNLDLLLDIEVDVSLRFGSRELAMRELMETGPGDVLELDRTIHDPVDLVVGDKIVARGEVVLVNGNFGLRVTEVAEPKKCLESVRCLF